MRLRRSQQTPLEVYAFNYKLTPDIENKIIAEFNSLEANDPGGPANHAALLESLIIGQFSSPSPVVTEFLSNLLDDPKWEEEVANRMGIDDVSLADAILYKLVNKLSQEQDPSKQAEFARAIGSYGARAQSYLPQLEAQLTKETDENAKFNLQAAIDKIKDPEHHLSRVEQMRKALVDHNAQAQLSQSSANPVLISVHSPALQPQIQPINETGIPLWIYGIVVLSLILIVGICHLLQPKK